MNIFKLSQNESPCLDRLMSDQPFRNKPWPGTDFPIKDFRFDESEVQESWAMASGAMIGMFAAPLLVLLSNGKIFIFSFFKNFSSSCFTVD